jgi:phosphate-selective porin
MLVRFAVTGSLIVLVTTTAGAQAPATATSSPAKLSGYVQARETYQESIGLTGTINRARLAASGNATGNITWRIQGEFRTGSVGTGKASVSLQDAYVRWAKDGVGVQLGQFKTPFTREFITSLAELETADRSTVVDSLAPKRDIGVMAEYAFEGRGIVTVGVFNGEGQNVTVNRDSSALGVARVVVRPVPFLALGTNVARYFRDSTRYGADASLESPWMILRAEYVGQHHDQVTGDDKGWYALAAAPVRPWVEPVLKYEWFNRPSVLRDAQKNRAWTAGVNVFPWGKATRLTLEYVSRSVGAPGIRKSQALAQAQVIF